MKLFGINFKPLQDTVFGGTAAVLTGGVSLLGSAMKKLFIRENDSMTKRVAVGALSLFAWPLTLPILAGYLTTSPGLDAKRDVVNARRDAASHIC